jgi:ketol-acid reductoisomerase
MPNMYYDKDADLGLLKNKTVGVIGFGSQGHAHAQNLRDSGVKVMVAEAKGTPGWAAAEKAGFKVADAATVSKAADTIIILVPDHLHAKVYESGIKENLTPGKTLMFAHGFVIHYKQVVPPKGVDVSMVAPKAPGHRMREMFVEGIGVPALLAVFQDASGKAKQNALAYAKGVGATKAGVLECTFKDEVETDLFGEQAVLCGGVTHLITAGFETLTEAGYPPELAYFECLHEMKLIVDLVYQGGMSYMRYSVSDTAEYGDYTRGPVVIDDHVRQNMRKLLKEVQDGTFAKEWIAEGKAGNKKFLKMREEHTKHPIEVVGKKLRSMMPWIKPPSIPSL